MPARLLRALFTLTAFAVVWLVASPARAESLVSSVPAPVSTVDGALLSRMQPQAPAPAATDAAPESFGRGAPMCDVRGATTFAPAPQMQQPEASIESGLTLEDCLNESATPSSRAARLGAARGRAPVPSELSSNCDPAALAAIAKLAAAQRELLPVPDASTTCPPSGVRSTVDRPPRS